MDGQAAAEIVLPDDALILVATRELVLFQGAIAPLNASRAATTEALQAAARSSRPVVVVLQRDPAVEQPTLTDLSGIGTEARLLRYMTAADGAHHAILQGSGRVRLMSDVEGLPYQASAWYGLQSRKPMARKSLPAPTNCVSGRSRRSVCWRMCRLEVLRLSADIGKRTQETMAAGSASSCCASS